MTRKAVGYRLALMALIALFSASMLLAADEATNTVASVRTWMDQLIALLPEGIRESAIWDGVKFLGVMVIKLSLGLGFAFIVLFVPFSQGLHVHWFITGNLKRAVLDMIRHNKDGAFGEIVGGSEIRSYRKIESPSREKVMKALNSHGGVFVVMGPAGGGKKLLVYAESKADYILTVEWEKWFESDVHKQPINEVLKERTNLLVRYLLPFMRKSICIVLPWKSGCSVPSAERMKCILEQLVGILGTTWKYSRISFVLAIPAYYCTESIRKNLLGCCPHPEEYSVNLLDCLECQSLLKSEMEFKAKNGKIDIAKCKSNLESKANELGVSLGRLIWIASFGMPEHVTNIVSKLQYDSPEVWESLRDWWRQVYTPENKARWYAYLYVIGLKSLESFAGRGTINAEAIAKKLFENDWFEVNLAMRLMCEGHRASGIGDDSAIQGDSSSQGTRDEFDLRRLDPLAVFEDSYIVDRFVSSLGQLKYGGSRWIFNFRTEMRDAVQKVFDLGDADECQKIAGIYLTLAGKSPNPAERVAGQYEFLKELKDAFWGDGTCAGCMLVDEYGRQLRNPVRFRSFVAELIGQQGAIPINLCTPMFKKINEILCANNSADEYTRMVFELLPAYDIGRWLPSAWGVDFKTVINEMNNPEANDDVKLRCAAIVCVAYMNTLSWRICHANSNDSGLWSVLEPAFMKLFDSVKKCRYRRFVSYLLSVANTAENVQLSARFKIAALPYDIRLTWLLILSRIMRSYGTMEIVDSISDNLNGLNLVGNDGMLVRDCLSRMPYWRYWNLELADHVNAMQKDIETLRRNLGRWTECPVIAVESFASLCDDYLVAFRTRQNELVNDESLWELLKFMRKCREGLTGDFFANVLNSFAKLIRGISECGIAIGEGCWNIYAEHVRALWKPIINGSIPMEDPVMANSYFLMYSNLSNVTAVSVGKRVALLEEIAPDFMIYLTSQTNSLQCVVAAKAIYGCSTKLIPPHLKLFWIAEIFAGRSVKLATGNSAEMIHEAEILIHEARDNGREIDNELIRRLYEENGLQGMAPDNVHGEE